MGALAYTTFLLTFGFGLGQEEWLFVGPGEGYTNQSEVLALPLGSGTCGLTIDPLPELLDGEGAFAALLEGLVTVCNAAEDERTHCFSLDPVLGAWVELIEPLPYEASGAEAISLPNGDMMILGGYGYGTLTRTSIYSLETRTWMEGPEMPISRAEFCAVSLNKTHTLVTGGGNENWVSESFIFDGASFHPIPAPQYLRSGAGCVLMASGGKVMVAGGMGPGGHDPDGRALDSVEIYDVASNSWSLGPSLPIGLGYPAAMVSRQDQVLFVGGYIDGSGYTTEIHSLSEGNWEDGWMVEEVELDEARGFNPSLVLHETNMLNC